MTSCKPQSFRGRRRFIANALLAAGAASPSLVCWTSAARAQYDAPADYYNGVSASAITNSTLFRTQIHAATSRNYFVPNSTLPVFRDYGLARTGLQIADSDPLGSGSLVCCYNGKLVKATWDGGITWNREHCWPESLGLAGANAWGQSDEHMLRVSDPSTNGSRANNPYGDNPGQFNPNQAAGIEERGDQARNMFYMDVRYDGPSGSDNTPDLQLINMSGLNQVSGVPKMGDLASLLKWNYLDPVSDRERRREDLVFDKNKNPSYYQGNRSPFVDHPEWVWAVFGDKQNDSKLYVGASATADGTSSTNVSLGRVMVGGLLGSQNVAINKGGADPTTFDVSIAGAGTISSTFSQSTVGSTRQQAFSSTAQSRNMTVGLTASTATSGLKSATITIDNTDVTTQDDAVTGASAGISGTGVNDGNDTINVSAAVLNNRLLSASAVDYGRVIAHREYTGYTHITTSGDDNNFTRVTVSPAGSGSGPVQVQSAFVGKTFTAASDTVTRAMTANFPSLGTYNGAIPMTVAGEGLTGETVQPLSVNFHAQVIDPSKGGLFDDDTTGGEGGPGDGSEATNTLVIDFGTIDTGNASDSTGAVRFFGIGNADGLRAGLDIDFVHGVGSTNIFTTSVSDFLHHTITAGELEQFAAILNPHFGNGTFSATYEIGLSDEDGVGGASAPGSTVLTLEMHASVVPEPVVLGPAMLLLTAGILQRRAREQR